MGRKKKYLTKEEKHEAQKKWAMEYYWRNKEIVRIKNLKNYHGKKNRDI
jgi:hypothetical protein